MAIAWDSKADLGRSSISTPWTVAFTNTAGDCQFFALYTDGSTGPAVTYNGVAMTLADSMQPVNATAYYGYLYVLISPATGANNFVVARSTSLDYIGMASSYSGTDTSGSGSSVLETISHNTGSGNPMSLAATVSTANAWLVGLGSGSNNLIAGSATTMRIASTASTKVWGIIDSNADQATGSRSLAIDDQSDFAAKSIMVASMKPAGGGGGSTDQPYERRAQQTPHEGLGGMLSNRGGGRIFGRVGNLYLPKAA